MMTKRVFHEIKLRCDVGLCDTARNALGTWECTTEEPGLRLAELTSRGWLFGDVDACPSCAKTIRERRVQPMEDPDGA